MSISSSSSSSFPPILTSPGQFQNMVDLVRVIGEKIADKIVDGAFSTFSRIASEYSRNHGGVESDIEKLTKTRTMIEATLNDSEQRLRIENAATKGVLRELKSLALDIEDLTDEFHTQINISKSNSSKRKYGAAFSTNRQFTARIANIEERYAHIFTDRMNLLLIRKGETPSTEKKGVTISYGHDDGAQIFGRTDETERVVKFLTSDIQGLPVFSIVGCGGVGKTALARSVFEDDAVSEYFRIKIWAPLGQGFDVMKATREIVRSIEKKEECLLRLSSLNSLQLHLKELVGRKRFLIVLDNVCNEELFFWEKLSLPLRGGVEGSKVLITTQSQMVSRTMQIEDEHRLQLRSLARVHSKQLLMARAFPRGNKEFSQAVDEISDELLDKCQDLPLVVKSIGGTLFNERDARKWSRMLEEMPESEAVVQTITPLLMVSYDHLPMELKHCLAFCSVFPAGYEFDKDELVKLWMALGLIKPKPTRRTRLEYIGDDYFDGLRWRSFFQACDGWVNDSRKYKIPNMVHILAQSVSDIDCLRMDLAGVQQDEAFKKARYALLHQQDAQPVAVDRLSGNECLRALILHGENGTITKHALSRLFKNLRFMRVLDLSCSMLDQLPDSIGDLILLRYINLHGTKISTLPESVGNLYNLQTLELGSCRLLTGLPESIGDLKHLHYIGLSNTNIERLPESLSKLSNLRALELGECYQLQELPIDLSRIASLSSFIIGPRSRAQLGVLKNWDLRGEFHISKLENVSGVDDVREANLLSKQHVHALILKWSDNGDAGSSSETGVSQEEVIEALQPHENLKELRIYNYKGATLPSWMETAYLSSLESLRLSNCRECQAVPCLGQLAQLKSLLIEGLHRVNNIDHVFPFSEEITGFPCLKTLALLDMPQLKRFEVIGSDMALLSELTISNCSALEELHHLPPKVVKLEVRDCGQLAALPEIPSLEELTISNLPLLIHLPRGLVSLRRLTVQECHHLWSLAEDVQSFPSLEYLDVSACREVSFYSEQKFPANLIEFRLNSCENATSLPELPPNLRSLTIERCHLLQEKCHKGGSLYPIVEKIPELNIDLVELKPPSFMKKMVAAILKIT